MSHPGDWQPPSSSLPPVRSLVLASEDCVDAALRNLHTIYCPLRLPTVIPTLRSREVSKASKIVDSGYTSEDEGDGDDGFDIGDTLATLRADEFERDFSVRWLISLIACAGELCFSSEETRERILDDAAALLASFTDLGGEDVPEAITRTFSFPTSLTSTEKIHVLLNDAPLSGTDHTDVGLQSWGASIILSGLICASPMSFGLDKFEPEATIIELGAGTGLVSLTLAALQPHLSVANIIATDYHPAVLENLRSNIATNFPGSGERPIETMLLDWSSPSLMLEPVSMLVAADAVYAPEHAGLLRDCAARLLAPDGVFWLIVTVRQHGKFEGIANTVDTAFLDSECTMQEDGKSLGIIEKQWLRKQKSIGRGDETGYNLYRIGWVEA